MSNGVSETRRAGYDATAAEEKWSRYWEQHKTFATLDDGSRERRYVLDMFAYPSGDLHMGHAEAFAIGDVVARYWRLKGYDVMHPVGWDSFGLPAENAAIHHGTHPAEWTYRNIDTQASSFRRYGISFDWDKRLQTSDEEYYRWTQWLFLKFMERGLAYRKDSWANWCPEDQTVLANEQVKEGRCERCGAVVTKRQLNQWYFRITDYAQRLLDDMSEIEGHWPERVLAMQRHWIGRSKGAYVDFMIDGHDEPVRVFTTRPDTLYGATFMVVAPDADLADQVVSDEQRPAFQEYLETVKKKTEIERQSTEHIKTGVYLGAEATNPVNGAKIPVWAADYVLADYGTGAIMAVPAHDQRDLDFARKYGIEVIPVIDTGEPDPRESGIATIGDGAYQNSGDLDGLTNKAEGVSRMCRFLDDRKIGEATITYRLRDWLLSRQRFWGCPIPVIHCPSCGDVPVPEDQLPVRLPDLRGADLAPKGVSPLAGEEARSWREVACPTCGGPAERDTDTMDTFVDSSWYYLRYCSPHDDREAFDPEEVRRWMPVAQYVGGVEHATMHLLYSRFFTKVLHDMGLVDFDEPFSRLMNQGQVINQGRAMSKSLGNGVDLGKQLDQFGVDAVRTTVIFAGPPEEDIDWADVSPGASLKFLQRAYRVAADVTAPADADPATGDLSLRRATHHAIAEITDLLDGGRFNVVVARIMELVNATRKAIDSGCGAADPAVREAVTFTAQALSMLAPYVSEEMWELLGNEASVANSSWPTADPSLLVADEVTLVVQVNGKVRGKIQVAPDISETDAVAAATADQNVQRHIGDKQVVKVIARLPKMISIVVR
ncbi:leucine--tRNA ligase [Acidipropionibacterium jensenii]|uniref:leucine--tRNA ligase n=2 Tax=Acidipropionibacterium jensenii TaxID=1749 RepID=UPI00264755E8|nr:leucine--tRNA ligase [Acidipropionibacterium jensenii]MDN5978399.1 leucine--tRNA ligase [Acidipropionibacterium jensenii]MDN5996082.1 leucine--tRNA ligase [Acidipropionibacterium jensenii]MDN6441095.1 leucine--tRNA ligase [Acidipropionibacterium jensenii]MDN6480029.1 leucine--tRNA ligase [Acidipropionibacterium jensenii]MDN6511996.1 leucine--tRNA ligase [Acidipropionibacterium jensenii]